MKRRSAMFLPMAIRLLRYGGIPLLIGLIFIISGLLLWFLVQGSAIIVIGLCGTGLGLVLAATLDARSEIARQEHSLDSDELD